MDHVTTTAKRKGFFDVKRRIQAFALPRPLQAVLIAIAALCPSGELSTERFPVTYEKIQLETGYSRSHAIALVRQLQDIGRLRVRKQPYIREDGRKWNRANVYEVILDDSVAHTSPEKAPRTRKTLVVSPQHQEPQDAPAVAQEWDFEDIPDYEPDKDLLAYYEAMSSEESTVPTQEEPQIEYVHDLSEEQPEEGPEPIGMIVAETQVVSPQSPDGFSREEREVAHELKRYADEKLDPMCAGPKAAQAIQGKLAFIGALYSLGRFAYQSMQEHGLGMNEMLACVDEWVVKCIPRPAGYLQQALRLRAFFLEKGHHIDRMRRRKLGIT